MKSKLILVGLLIALNGFSQSLDSVLIVGQIISRDKHPMQGVTVSVANTDNIVRSDVSGQFELWAPIEGIIEFSCVSAPYRISVSSVGVSKEKETMKFEFDLKQPGSNYRTKKLKGRTIKVNPGHISDIILAYYTSDFERITRKHYDLHRSQHHKIMFMIDGQVKDENFTPDQLDFNSIKDIAILRIIDSMDKIIFMISTNVN